MPEAPEAIATAFVRFMENGSRLEARSRRLGGPSRSLREISLRSPSVSSGDRRRGRGGGGLARVVHPAAHIHIGYQSEIRLFTERKVLPLSFGLFVLRQVYPKKWKDFLKLDKAAALCRHVREELEVVAVEYYQPKDKLQLVLA